MYKASTDGTLKMYLSDVYMYTYLCHCYFVHWQIHVRQRHFAGSWVVVVAVSLPVAVLLPVVVTVSLPVVVAVSLPVVVAVSVPVVVVASLSVVVAVSLSVVGDNKPDSVLGFHNLLGSAVWLFLGTHGLTFCLVHGLTYHKKSFRLTGICTQVLLAHKFQVYQQ